jgi:DNA-binding NtrC family response regulator
MEISGLKNKGDENTLIYFVDDDLIYLKVVSHDLEKQGYKNVRSFSNAKDIIAAVKEKKPDIALLDYHLGGKTTGIDVLKRIKELSPETQNIFLTASDDINVAIETMKHGAYDYVIKGDTALIRINHILGNICTHLKANKKGRVILLYKIMIVFLIAILATLLSIKSYMPVN